MTMDLIGTQGARTIQHAAWRLRLDLALQYGWQPAGALPPAEEDIDDEKVTAVTIDIGDANEPGVDEDAQVKVFPHEDEPVNPVADAIRQLVTPPADPILATYFFNEGCRVTPEDARSLAAALERALPDVPDHDAMEHKTFEHEGAPGVRFIRFDTPTNPFEWFSGPNKEHLRDFILYCRQGGFEIW